MSAPTRSPPPSRVPFWTKHSTRPASSAVVVSFHSPNPGSFWISGPAIQSVAVTIRMIDTRRSATDIGPSATRASTRRSRAVACSPSRNGNANRTRTSQATGNSSTTVGMPNASHSVKLMVSP